MSTPLEQKLQQAVEEIESIRAERTKHLKTLSQLDTQLQENKLVAQELDLVAEDEDEVVFKMIGPTLVKQDLGEAKSNVAKRIEYIQKELSRYEIMVKNSQENEREAEMKALKLKSKVEEENLKKQASAGKA
eukprot:TRINITY_DN9188_c0_g2_i3.p1 TRINITY_DN9188_c0_g2~~TRINITY_DN9188_c0_g2_i3.p1  ORF type:complete len:132 (+),score=54.80 TRINITY_DN9188_c0_g2_i3:112-507(+)